MKEKSLQPCSEWAEKLAALHPEDLSPSDLIALNKHLSQCTKCAIIHCEYEGMRNALREFVSIYEAPTVFPSELVEQWVPEERNEDETTYSCTVYMDAFLMRKSYEKYGNLCKNQRQDVKKVDVFFDLPPTRGTYRDLQRYMLLQSTFSC